VALVRQRTILTEQPLLVNEVSANFADRYRRVISGTDPYGHILGFIDRSGYIFFHVAAQLYSEAEWTPFQDHYFSENLVAPGIEPGPL
jgi:hypothetical protein